MTFKRFFWNNIKKYWRGYLPGVITLLIVDIVQLLIPLVIASAVNRLEYLEITKKELWYYGALLVGIALIMSLMRFLWRYFIIFSSFRISRDTRSDLMKKLYSLPIEFFVKNNTGDVMSNVVNDVDAIRFFMGMGMVAAFDMTILAAMAVGYMFYLSPSLTLIAMIPAPFIVAILYFFEGPLHRRFLSIQNLFGKMSVKVKESIEGIALIKLYRLYGLKEKEFSKANSKYRKDNMFVTTLDALYHPVVHFFMMGVMALLIYHGGIKVIDDEIRLGDFVAFTRYIEIIIWPMIALGWVFSLYQRARGAFERINIIFQEKNNIKNGYIKDISLKGNINIHNMKFEYPDSEFSLKDINIKIEEKTLCGITGKIGSGKTTLLNLILRLYDCTDGNIQMDSVNIKDMDISLLRNSIAYVPQETFLFSDSIKNNLLFSDFNKTDEELVEALKMADAWEFVCNMPKGIETIVGERGISLSGGQKQRIALARALLLKRPIIIMDDCLSAVDSKTEKTILDNLKTKWKHSTSIVVSHRLSAFYNADKIYVMHDGNIIQQGTHDLLKEKEGLYRTIFLKQQIEEELEHE